MVVNEEQKLSRWLILLGGGGGGQQERDKKNFELGESDAFSTKTRPVIKTYGGKKGGVSKTVKEKRMPIVKKKHVRG